MVIIHNKPSHFRMNPSNWGILLDLDETLVLTAAIEYLRRRRAWQDVYASFNKTTLPPGTKDFIRKAERLGSLGVITTSPRTYAERILAHHRLEIPVLVAYHDVRLHKPHPEPIIKAAEKLGFSIDHCVHIGDREHDITAALRAGAIPVGLSWDGGLKKQLGSVQAKTICNNWDEVYSFLKALPK